MRIAVIPGDGIGVETTAEAVKALRAASDVFGRPLDLELLPWSADHFLSTGVTIPADGYDTLRGFDAIFIGALGDPRVPDNRHARDILLDPVRARSVRQLPARQASRRATVSAERAHAAGHRLHRVPGEHRGRLRRHRRPLQTRHR